MKITNVLLLKAVKEDNYGAAERLLKIGADPNCTLDGGLSPLHYAVGTDSCLALQFTKLLLSYAGDPNVSGENGMTPLHVAACQGRHECLQILIQNGGNPYLTDQENENCFVMATRFGELKCIEILKDYQYSDMEMEEECDTAQYTVVELSDLGLLPRSTVSSRGSSVCSSDFNGRRSSRSSTCSTMSEFNHAFYGSKTELDSLSCSAQMSESSSAESSPEVHESVGTKIERNRSRRSHPFNRLSTLIEQDTPRGDKSEVKHSLSTDGSCVNDLQSLERCNTNNTVNSPQEHAEVETAVTNLVSRLSVGSPPRKCVSRTSVDNVCLPDIPPRESFLQPSRLSSVFPQDAVSVPRRQSKIEIPTRKRQSFYTQHVQKFLDDFDNIKHVFDVTSPDHSEVISRNGLVYDDNLDITLKWDECNMENETSDIMDSDDVISFKTLASNFQHDDKFKIPSIDFGGYCDRHSQMHNSQSESSVDSFVTCQESSDLGHHAKTGFNNQSSPILDACVDVNSDDDGAYETHNAIGTNNCKLIDEGFDEIFDSLMNMKLSDSPVNMQYKRRYENKHEPGSKWVNNVSQSSNCVDFKDRNMDSLLTSDNESVVSLNPSSHRQSPTSSVHSSRPSSRQSVVSQCSVLDYLYTDDEGVSLIERHLLPEGALDSVNISVDSDSTEIYDWKKFLPSNEEELQNDMEILEEDKQIEMDKLISADCDCNHEKKDSELPEDLECLSNQEIRQALVEHGDNPGPVNNATRRLYLSRLTDIKDDPNFVPDNQSEFFRELDDALHGRCRLDDSLLLSMECDMCKLWQLPDPSRKWREGVVKASFNYLLLDPRVTQNLPARAKAMDYADVLKTFLSAIFYIGKGKRARPYCHFKEALRSFNNVPPDKQVSKKVRHILNIWDESFGVISLHVFQNTIPVEAYTREALMIEALGLSKLTNQKKGEYYGTSTTWQLKQKRQMGVYFLQRALGIFLLEGERQIRPVDLACGQ